ncbi:hypothetical protein ACO0OL_001393 [Hanseniaspora opuntiae]
MGKVNKRNKRSKKVGQQVPKIHSTKFQNLIKEIDQSVIPNERLAFLSQLNILVLQHTGKDNITMDDCKQAIDLIVNKLISDNNTTIKLESVGVLRNVILLINESNKENNLMNYLWDQKSLWDILKNGMDNSTISLNNLIEKKADLSIKADEYEMLIDYIDNILHILTLVITNENSEDIMMNFLNTDSKLDDTCSFLLKNFEYCLNGNNKLNYKLLSAVLEFLYEFSSQSLQFLEYLFTKMPELLKVVKSLQFNVSSGDNEHKKMYNVLLIGLLIQISELENTNSEQLGSYLKNIMENSQKLDFEQTKSVNIMEISLDLIIADLENIGEKLEKGEVNLNSDDLQNVLINALPSYLNSLYEELNVAKEKNTSLIIRLLLCWNNYILLSGSNIFNQSTLIEYITKITHIDEEADNLIEYKLTTLQTLIEVDCNKFVQDVLIKNGNGFIKMNDVTNNSANDSFCEQIMTMYLKESSDLEIRERIVGILINFMKISSSNLSNIGKFLLSLINIEKDEQLLIKIFYKIFEIFGLDEEDIRSNPNIHFDKMELDQVYESLKIQDKLSEISKNINQLKTIVHDKQAMRELTNNLNGFLQYKLYN